MRIEIAAQGRVDTADLSQLDCRLIVEIGRHLLDLDVAIERATGRNRYLQTSRTPAMHKRSMWFIRVVKRYDRWRSILRATNSTVRRSRCDRSTGSSFRRGLHSNRTAALGHQVLCR